MRKCRIEDCSNTALCKQLCNKHYLRQKIHGDPRTLLTAANGEGSINHGYIRHYKPDHPLATKNGKVYEHQLVLYEKIGPGQHICHWCQDAVRWKETLVVDHLDWDKQNNNPENLVPSCNPCNVRRVAPSTKG